ncbi:hypothetical protein ABPG72_009359 [Tetrahymena utriculariae]
MKVQPIPSDKKIAQTFEQKDINQQKIDLKFQNFQGFQQSEIDLQNLDNSYNIRHTQINQTDVYKVELNQQQINKNEKEVHQQGINRERIYSDVTTMVCWLCNDLQKPSDPFVSNCNCTGSNHIHAMCLAKVVQEEIKKQSQSNQQEQTRKNTYEHKCSICKYKFQSVVEQKFKLNFSVTLGNIWFVIFGVLCFVFSVVILAISLKVFVINNESSGAFKDIYLGFVIFLGVFSIIVILSFFILFLFLFYKAFIYIVPFHLKLLSNIKDKIILYQYDQEQKTYIYIFPTSHNNEKVMPQTQITHFKSPQIGLQKIVIQEELQQI